MFCHQLSMDQSTIIHRNSSSTRSFVHTRWHRSFRKCNDQKLFTRQAALIIWSPFYAIYERQKKIQDCNRKREIIYALGVLSNRFQKHAYKGSFKCRIKAYCGLQNIIIISILMNNVGRRKGVKMEGRRRRF